MNRYGKKAVSMLLLLVMLCTITAMAAAEGEENTSGVVVVLTPEGTNEIPTAGTEANTPSGDAETANQPAGNEQGASAGPGTSGTENTTESDASVTVSETGPGGASTTETAATDPTPTPSPTPSAAPKPASTGLPTVTKHPTDETVDIGGECVFIANYSNAIWAVWHFVSPDGKTDYRFDFSRTEGGKRHVQQHVAQEYTGRAERLARLLRIPEQQRQRPHELCHRECPGGRSRPGRGIAGTDPHTHTGTDPNAHTGADADANADTGDKPKSDREP